MKIEPKTLSELIRLKEGVLLRLVSVSYRQRKLVQEEDVSTLLELLARKQKILDEFDVIERKLDPFRDIPPEKRVWKSEEERIETSAKIERCQEMLAEILEIDGQSTQMMSVQKSDLEEQIRKVQQGARMQSTYAKQGGQPSNVRRFNTES